MSSVFSTKDSLAYVTASKAFWPLERSELQLQTGQTTLTNLCRARIATSRLFSLMTALSRYFLSEKLTSTIEELSKARKR